MPISAPFRSLHYLFDRLVSPGRPLARQLPSFSGTMRHHLDKF
jgi:hypothetical protein